MCADGAYATLAGAGTEHTTVISRMRRDAALYGPAPTKTGKAGRPAKKGKRLATPAQFTKKLRRADFTEAVCEFRGRQVTKLVWSKEVLVPGEPHSYGPPRHCA